MDYVGIGKRIRAQRYKLDLSQEELAEMAGISLVHMSHIETANTKLSLPVLVDLACALGVRTDDLIFDKDTLGKDELLEEDHSGAGRLLQRAAADPAADFVLV